MDKLCVYTFLIALFNILVIVEVTIGLYTTFKAIDNLIKSQPDQPQPNSVDWNRNGYCLDESEVDKIRTFIKTGQIDDITCDKKND